MKEAGLITVLNPEGDKPIAETPTLQCVHCGKHWTVRPGSGNLRGFCFRCNGPVCGPKCAGHCRPAEQLLENIEAGRDEHHVPIRQAVKLWTPGGQ